MSTPQEPLTGSIVYFASGFTSGLLVSAGFNPWDRALYLSVKDRRPFLHRENWLYPFQGVRQTLFARAISSGLYFPLEQLFLDRLQSMPGLSLGWSTTTMLAGQGAGAMNGILLHPLAVVKYKTWGHLDEKRSFLSTARAMFSVGPRTFFRALPTTILRDTVFGTTFTFGRRRGKTHFLLDLTAAGCATVLSAPFNYIRNMQFAQNISQPLSVRAPVLLLLSEVRAKPLGAGLVHLSLRLQLGWGTLRVATGMAVMAEIYRGLLHLSCLPTV